MISLRRGSIKLRSAPPRENRSYMAANMLWLVVVACSFVTAGVVWLIGCVVSLSFFALASCFSTLISYQILRCSPTLACVLTPCPVEYRCNIKQIELEEFSLCLAYHLMKIYSCPPQKWYLLALCLHSFARWLKGQKLCSIACSCWRLSCALEPLSHG